MSLSSRALRTLVSLVRFKDWGILKGTVEGTVGIEATALEPAQYSTLSKAYVDMFKTSNIPSAVMTEFHEHRLVAVTGAYTTNKVVLELTGMGLALAKRYELRGSAIYNRQTGEQVLDSLEEEYRKLEEEVTDPAERLFEPRD